MYRITFILVALAAVVVMVASRLPVRMAQEEHGAHGEGEEEGVVRLTPERRAAAGINTRAVERMSMPVIVRTTGTIEPDANRLAHVGPLVAGVVESVTEQGHLGRAVAPGDTLAVLHSVEIGGAQSEYLRALAMLRLAEQNHERVQALHDRRVTSGRDLLDVQAALEAARIDAQATEAQLGILGLSPEMIAELRQQETLPDGHFEISAPIQGVIIEKHMVQGEFVSAESALFTVADLSRLWVQSNIYERDLARIRAGLRVEVSVAAYADARFPGTIEYVGAVMDEQTRTVRARVVVDEHGGRLRPGMFAQVHIEVERREAVLAVPESAVQSYAGADVVFFEEEPNHFEVRRIVTGVRFGGFVEVVEGIEEGIPVVSEGAFLLRSELEKGSFEAGHSH